MNDAGRSSSGVGDADRRRLRATVVLTALILVLEAAGGFLSGSLALLSDAGHVGTDLLALLLSLFAITFAALPATDRKTYGYYRLEILAALLNGVLLVTLTLFLLYESVRRLARPRPVETDLMLGVAVLGLLVNLAGIALLSPARKNLNIRSALFHLVGDAFSSVGVVLGAVAMKLTGWYRADPLISILIAGVILWGALRLMKEACDILLEAAPAGLEIADVSRAILSVEGVCGIHDLHVWSITTGMPALSGHVVVRSSYLRDSDGLLNSIKRLLEVRFGICHTTLQLESEGYQEVGEIHPGEPGSS